MSLKGGKKNWKERKEQKWRLRLLQMIRVTNVKESTQYRNNCVLLNIYVSNLSNILRSKLNIS